MKNIVVLGDLIIDEWVYGETPRKSPEANIPIFIEKQRKISIGGAGNLYLNLKSILENKYYVSILSISGDNGNELEQLHFDAGNTELIDKSCTKKTRFVNINTGEQYLRIDRDVHVSIEEVERHLLNYSLFEDYCFDVSDDDILFIVSDYGKGNITKDLMDMLRNCKKKFVVDTKNKDWNLYKSALLIKPNLKEFEEAYKFSFNEELIPKTDNDFSDILKNYIYPALYKMSEKFNINMILLTLSENGMVFYNNGSIIHKQSYVKNLIDVTGAGDCVLAAVVSVLNFEDKNIDSDILIDVSSKAAAKCCEEKGTYILRKEDLNE